MVARLSRERVAQRALAVIDGHGLDGFSMRLLCADLQVQVSAVYHWYDGKAAIFDAVAELIRRESVHVDELVHSPSAAGLLRFGHRFHAGITAHAPAAALLARRSNGDLERQAVDALTAHGYPPAVASDLVQSVLGFVLGITLHNPKVASGVVDEGLRALVSPMVGVGCASEA